MLRGRIVSVNGTKAEDIKATPNAAWLIGRVVTADGRPVPDARWTLRQRDVLGERRIVRDAEVGSDGVFQYCELHRGTDVVIGVRAKGMEDTSVSLSLTKQPTAMTVDFGMNGGGFMRAARGACGSVQSISIISPDCPGCL